MDTNATYKTAVSLCLTSVAGTEVSCVEKYNFKEKLKPFRARMARIFCILGLLLFTLCAVENTKIEEGIKSLQLQQDGLTSLRKFPDSLVSLSLYDI